LIAFFANHYRSVELFFFWSRHQNSYPAYHLFQFWQSISRLYY